MDMCSTYHPDKLVETEHQIDFKDSMVLARIASYTERPLSSAALCQLQQGYGILS
jgi:hypothetical protein